MENPILVIMAKWPAYGRCKTRLSKDIGKDHALNVQKHMLSHTISVSKYLEKKGYLNISLATNGIGFKTSERWCTKLGISKFNLQGNGSLGEKMRRQILINNRLFLDNKKRDYIFIGTDLPDLCHLDLLEAIAKIKENDLVFGPSEDGGYWLIGLSKEIASRNIIYPFINIKWSGRDVLQKTLDNLSSQNLKIDFLSCKVDIDTIKDLETRTKSFHNYSYS